jgi:hypothetical protein
MNRTIATALIAFAAASSAFADDITIEARPFVSTLSTAQVQAELQQFKQSGVNPWAMSYNPLANFRSARTREEVTAEYLRSREETAALTAEDSGSAYLAAHNRATTAAPVLAGQPVNAQ